LARSLKEIREEVANPFVMIDSSGVGIFALADTNYGLSHAGRGGNRETEDTRSGEGNARRQEGGGMRREQGGQPPSLSQVGKCESTNQFIQSGQITMHFKELDNNLIRQ
jgi:hypothetical protein